MRKVTIMCLVCLLAFALTSIGFAFDEEDDIYKRHKEWLAKIISGESLIQIQTSKPASKIDPYDPAYGAEIAAGWLAEELGIKENKIICTGYDDLDAPVIYGDLVCITQGARRYAFHFKIKREPDVEYIVIGAWDLSVPPGEQGWIKIGATIAGRTAAEFVDGGANEQPANLAKLPNMRYLVVVTRDCDTTHTFSSLSEARRAIDAVLGSNLGEQEGVRLYEGGKDGTPYAMDMGLGTIFFVYDVNPDGSITAYLRNEIFQLGSGKIGDIDWENIDWGKVMRKEDKKLDVEALTQAVKDAMDETGVIFFCGYGADEIANLLPGVDPEDVEGLQTVGDLTGAGFPVSSSDHQLSEEGWKDLVRRLVIKYGDSILGKNGKVNIELFKDKLTFAPINDEILQRSEVEQTVESQHADPLFSPQMADGQQGIIPLQEKQ